MGIVHTYDEAEADYDWPQPESAPRFERQYFELQNELRDLVRKRSESEQLEPDDYSLRLGRAQEFLEDVSYSLWGQSNSGAKEVLWAHRQLNLDDLDLTRGQSLEVDIAGLEDAARRYLRTPWMQHPFIDWLLIDALIAAEFSAFRDSLLSGEALGQQFWNGPPYLRAGKNIQKAQWLKVKDDALLFGARHVVPIAVIALLLWLDMPQACVAAAVLYGGYLIYRLVSWPLRIIRWRGMKKKADRSADLLMQILRAYNCVSPPAISLQTLRHALHNAMDNGAIFSNEVFALISNAETRHGDVLFCELDGKHYGI